MQEPNLAHIALGLLCCVSIGCSDANGTATSNSMAGAGTAGTVTTAMAGSGGDPAGDGQGGSSAGTGSVISAGSGGTPATAGAGGEGDVDNTPRERDFSSDRALFFGDSRCEQADVVFCEDFESGQLDPATWTSEGTAPTVDGLQAARGSKALHVQRTGNGNSRIRETKSFPAQNGRYWGRAFVYLNAMPRFSEQGDSLNYSHWTIIAATGAVVDGEVRIGGQLQKRFDNPTPLNFWGVGTDNRNQPEGSGDWTNADNDPPGAPMPVVEKQWSCIEWMGDYMTDETKFFLDGVEHPSLATTPETKHGGNSDKPFLLPEFETLWFGWAEYQSTTQSFELWFDEIALDHERIGCVL